MQIGCVRLSRVKRDEDALAFKIDVHLLHAVNFHERRAQLAHAFVAVFAFGRDLDRFQNRMIGVFEIMRIARVWIVWSGWVHACPYLTYANGSVVASYLGCCALNVERFTFNGLTFQTSFLWQITALTVSGASVAMFCGPCRKRTCKKSG